MIDVLKDLNELKGGLENFTDIDLIENREKMLEMVEDIIEEVRYLWK